MSNLRKLCIDIATKEDGQEVIEILKQHNLWDNEENWRVVGYKSEQDNLLNNHSIIGSQQSNAANALVEKLINSGDSALILNCLENGINPESDDAPKNMKEAVSNFFDVKDGRWVDTPTAKKRELAEKYCNLVVTGEKGRNANPTYTIIDSAEGQEPHDFHKTFLSLTQKNKSGIRFVQGKFGMGSYGAVNFCRVDGLQLIISKRNPSIISDNSENLWGFTIIRKIAPTRQQRSSKWVYLIIDNEIPQFDSSYLELLPGDYPNAYGRKLEYGSFIKLYNYDIGSSLRTQITLDLCNKLNTLLVNPVVPIRLYERRNGFNAHTNDTTLDGLETRLERDRSAIVANGFPSEFMFNVNNQRFRGKVYAFNKYANEETKTLTDISKYGKGILFCINGQSNGYLPPSFFSTGNLKYENISKNLLVIIDCTEVEPKFIEDLFQNDRERIYFNSFTKNIREVISQELADHDGLKKFQHDWKSNEIRSIKDNKNTKELFNRLLSSNRNLLNYLFGGNRLNYPFGKKTITPEFESEFYPTFFKLVKLHTQLKPRPVERDRNAKILFVSDAPNDYFTRPIDPGSFKVFFEDSEITNDDGIKLSGFNGNWNLWLPPREETLQKYRFLVNDDSRVEPFEIEFFLELIEKKEHSKKEKKHPKDLKDIPRIIQLGEANFKEHNIDKNDMLYVTESMEDGYDYYLNMDNIDVLSYLKNLDDLNVDLAKKQYEICMSLLGLVLIETHKNSNNEKPLGEFTKSYSRCLSPIIMPCIRDIAEI